MIWGFRHGMSNPGVRRISTCSLGMADWLANVLRPSLGPKIGARKILIFSKYLDMRRKLDLGYIIIPLFTASCALAIVNLFA